MPLVTAVMPTREARRDFWRKSLTYFAAQTFEDCELLILEEAAAPADFVPPPRVRYEHILPTGWGAGTKRNTINSRAYSDIIIHWDDDDWYHPSRIETQVNYLLELRSKSVQVVGYHSLLYYRVTDGTFWQYHCPKDRQPYATGTSQCYWREWWQHYKFRELPTAEDSLFSDNARWFNALSSLPLSNMIVAQAHTSNTYRAQFGMPPFLAATPDIFPAEFLAGVTHSI